MRNMTIETAMAVFYALMEAKLPCGIGYRYHEKLAPAETYSVQVNVGPGRFDAEMIRNLFETCDKYGCEPHLIGQSFLILPKP